MLRGYFMTMIKFYLLEFLVRKGLFNSCGRPLRLTIARYTEVVLKAGEDYAATVDYRVDYVCVNMKKRLIFRANAG